MASDLPKSPVCVSPSSGLRKGTPEADKIYIRSIRSKGLKDLPTLKSRDVTDLILDAKFPLDRVASVNSIPSSPPEYDVEARDQRVHVYAYLRPFLEEYFDNGTSKDFAVACESVSVNSRYEIVEYILQVGIDKTFAHNDRESLSVLISDLYSHRVGVDKKPLLSDPDIIMAFDYIADQLSDLRLDAPDAVETFGKFVARCVADDVIPPKYVNAHWDLAKYIQHSVVITFVFTNLSLRNWSESLVENALTSIARNMKIQDSRAAIVSTGENESASVILKVRVVAYPHAHEAMEAAYAVQTAQTQFPEMYGPIVKARYAPPSEKHCAFEVAHGLLAMPHGLQRLEEVWGSTVKGDRRPVKYVVKKIIAILEEFLQAKNSSAQEISEVERCLHDLAVPHFHHEVVYEAIYKVLCDTSTKTETSCATQLCALLTSLSNSAIITPQQMELGFQRSLDELTDITLDSPAAPARYKAFVTQCKASKALAATFAQGPGDEAEGGCHLS